MLPEPPIDAVLAHYPADCQTSRRTFLGQAGGFSGALLWRLECPAGPLCLRRWPAEHPPADRLEFIQAVLWHVDQQGYHLTPVPRETRTHAGYVRHGGHFWELAPWMPGQANFLAAPSPERLTAAMRALAQFHLAAATFPLPHAQPSQAPGILERRDQVRHLAAGFLEELAGLVRAPSRQHPAEFVVWAERYLQLARYVLPVVQRQLETSAARMAWVLPCLRDIRHDHVLFSGNRVTGLVDFGSLRPDCSSCDIARLLGSLAGDEPTAWQAGLLAYRGVRELLPAEELLVPAYDRSGVLLSGLNWLEWIFVQGRTFADEQAVRERFAVCLARLEHLAKAIPVPPGVARL